jgi:hypothetical protein
MITKTIFQHRDEDDVLVVVLGHEDGSITIGTGSNYFEERSQVVSLDTYAAHKLQQALAAFLHHG